MNFLMPVNVLEFVNDDEKMTEDTVCEPTVYDDGTVQLAINLTGARRVYVRFPLSELVRISMTTDSREEAP